LVLKLGWGLMEEGKDLSSGMKEYILIHLG
jgi:hypothetical protein